MTFLICTEVLHIRTSRAFISSVLFIINVHKSRQITF